MKKLTKLTALLAASVLTLGAQVSNAGRILLTQFDYSGYTTMKSNLEADGHTVDIVDARTGGNLASALSSNSYDELFLWDLTSSLYLNSADIAAVQSFWNPSMGIVVDSRSYGYYFQGNQASEVQLLQNVASALDLSGGGLWIGSDHDPQWTRNANPVLSALGFNQISGSYSYPVNVADPSSYLLNGVTPTDLWGGGASVGSVPVGLQSNGVEMFMHFGNNTNGNITPYISASFDLQGPVAVPEPGTLSLFALGLAALSFSRKKKVS